MAAQIKSLLLHANFWLFAHLEKCPAIRENLGKRRFLTLLAWLNHK
jgi:hypothetical protein